MATPPPELVEFRLVPGVTVTGRVLQRPVYTEAYLGYLNANSSQTDTQGIAVLGVTFSEQVCERPMACVHWLACLFLSCCEL